VFKKDDKVKIIKTGEIGYVDRVSDCGERLMVRIPASDGWPFPHHVYVAKDNVHHANDKTKPKKVRPDLLDWRAPL
jgi:hypothetical protein